MIVPPVDTNADTYTELAEVTVTAKRGTPWLFIVGGIGVAWLLYKWVKR